MIFAISKHAQHHQDRSKSIINQKSINILNEFTHARRRNDSSDATQPICLEDYAEMIIDLHSLFQPPTTCALVTGSGHAWSL